MDVRCAAPPPSMQAPVTGKVTACLLNGRSYDSKRELKPEYRKERGGGEFFGRDLVRGEPRASSRWRKVIIL